MKKNDILSDVLLGKFVHGGQCLATAPDGKTLFVWGGLPDEIVTVRIAKLKSSYAEAVVVAVLKPSRHRVEPKEPLSYLSTSPWQILSFDAENRFKQAIVHETFEREGVPNIEWSTFYAGTDEYGYRNKMEIGFWGDDKGLHLAHYKRGSHKKQIVENNALVASSINQAARDVRDGLQKLGVWAGKLKTLVLRCNQADQAVGALFVKQEFDMTGFELPKSLQGLDVYYSNPKSPASVPTKKVYSFGDITLYDSVGGVNIKYDVLSFFQVNLPVFEKALSEIKHVLRDYSSIDLFSGVGTIGVIVGAQKLIEIDKHNCFFATNNSKGSDIEVICASSEAALEHISENQTIIIDPPRAGMHKALTKKLAEVRAPQIVYLSCNPATQARDVKLLASTHKIVYARGFNFFPKTPHIETLIVLERIA